MNESGRAGESPQPLVLVTVEDGVAQLVLNRPERQNAWTGALGAQYFSALDSLSRDARVRVIMVSGAAGSFCVGADPQLLGGLAANAGQAPPERHPFPYWLPLSIGKPIIAAVAGPCFGIGMQQALCCDLRFVAEDVKFSTAYARRGLVAEMGMSWLLPRIVGVGHAMDLLLSARVVRAAEAERIGLANRVVPSADLLAETMTYARLLATQCAPSAMRTMKGQVYRDLNSDLLSAYARSETMLAEAFKSSDFAEGVASLREKRLPAFPPLPEKFASLMREIGDLA